MKPHKFIRTGHDMYMCCEWCGHFIHIQNTNTVARAQQGCPCSPLFKIPEIVHPPLIKPRDVCLVCNGSHEEGMPCPKCEPQSSLIRTLQCPNCKVRESSELFKEVI